MRAIVMTATGGPAVLTLAELDAAKPGPGQVAVAVEYSGVNYHDVYVRSGLYPKPLPYTPGIEGAGVVAAVGPGVDDVWNGELSEGDRVAWVNQPGGYAESVVLPADRVVRVPDDVELELAAGGLLQGMTTHYLTHDTYAVGPGDTVLVHAAAGGMGLLLTQIAHGLGARVIGTVSSAAKAELARAAGADDIVDYRHEPVASRVRELTGGRGVDVVYDGVGAPTFEGSLASLRPRGVLAAYGQAGGVPGPVDVLALRDAGSVYLTRPDLNHHIASTSDLRDRADAVFTLLRDGLRVRVGGRYPLGEAGRAHADLESRATTGKLLLHTRS
jgi:NADPH:quinone reductase